MVPISLGVWYPALRGTLPGSSQLCCRLLWAFTEGVGHSTFSQLKHFILHPLLCCLLIALLAHNTVILCVGF